MPRPNPTRASRPKGICPRCYNEVAIRTDGKTQKHGARAKYGTPCPGSNELPYAPIPNGQENAKATKEITRTT